MKVIGFWNEDGSFLRESVQDIARRVDEVAVAHVWQHHFPDRLVERQQILESQELPTAVTGSPKGLFVGDPDLVRARLVAVGPLERRDHGAHRIRDLITPL
ncbi:hypothetical protein AQJ46_50210 [Streptomyces canus]|uniref:Uncharacterized protein n=1 Tax=Streptomyces canus TaxID=58343 RepID=A0A124HV05_9ACTN|nr:MULTISPECIES: hypothetical protein [Streptomyces]KUN53461.1 hypothetical protein AQJ46_50210 [Streptomyces canus]MDI5912700.1 hypothetical protein [Streptomyces sp. 12257]